MNKFKHYILGVVMLALSMVPITIPPMASAATISDSVCGAAQDLTVDSTKTCADTKGSEKNFQNLLATIVNVLSLVVGALAVVMIIFAGFRYITSGGNQEGVKSAKQALIYAIIGIIIVALAQIIVKFVLNQANKTTETSKKKSSYHIRYNIS